MEGSREIPTAKRRSGMIFVIREESAVIGVFSY
jgi:hypothetical protein